MDHFKAFNDREGHLAGDEALKKITRIVSKNLRKTDIFARYGGEEFIILMLETQVPIALEICDRLRSLIEFSSFPGKEDDAFLTVSMGLAGFPEGGKTVEDLVKSADHSLYLAKEQGRNRIIAG